MSAATLLAIIRARIESGDIRTWANGYGVWHAAVPASYTSPHTAARWAIWLELRDRYDTRAGTVPRPRTERAPDYDTGDRIAYREATD